MSEEDWTIVSKPVVVANKWDDEEDDEVKENWDDDDEDVSKSSSNGDSTAQSSQPDAAKAAASIKKKKQKALKEKLLQKELEMQKPRTKEELLADKLERQRLQEESDLALAKDAFGIEAGGSDSSALASIQLASRQDFEAFRKALTSKFSNYTTSPYFVPFLEELFREIAVDLEADDIKKLDTVLTTIFNEKIKLQKQQTKGKKGKKAKDVIQMERDGDYSYNQSSNYDEFEDFI